MPKSKRAIEPVTIEWGTFEAIATVEGLAECLLHNWPVEDKSEAYVTALMVCDAVLTGSDEDEPADARVAFVEAAHEAGFAVG